MKRDKIEVYTDEQGKWRWRFLASNGRIMADSAQGYDRKADAINGLKWVVGVDEWVTVKGTSTFAQSVEGGFALRADGTRFVVTVFG